jgi:hypothetical protein
MAVVNGEVAPVAPARTQVVDQVRTREHRPDNRQRQHREEKGEERTDNRQRQDQEENREHRRDNRQDRPHNREHRPHNRQRQDRADNREHRPDNRQDRPHNRQRQDQEENREHRPHNQRQQDRSDSQDRGKSSPGNNCNTRHNNREEPVQWAAVAGPREAVLVSVPLQKTSDAFEERNSREVN